MTHVIALNSDKQRAIAKRYVDAAPQGCLVKFDAAERSQSQNNMLWALLSQISKAKPGGRCHTPEQWKSLFMHALGHECRFMEGLNGEAFPTGFKSSRLSKGQMSDLIEFVYAWSAQNNIELTTPN